MLEHRSAHVKQAAVETLRDLEHPSSEAPLLRLLEHETDRHVRKMAFRTMHGCGVLADGTIDKLLSEWQQRRADVRGHGCVAACVRSTCNPHAHREDCRAKCKRQCAHEHTNHDELENLLRKHTKGRRLYRVEEHDEGYQEVTAVLPDASSAAYRVMPLDAARRHHLRGRQLFDWDNINFDEFSLTFLDLRIKLPGGLDMHEEMGMQVKKVSFFGIKVDVVIDNRGWIRIGLFGGGFGVHFVDEGSAVFIPGFGSFELFYGGFRFKFDATYRNSFAEGLSKGLRAVTSIADTILAKLESLLKVVKDKLKFLICQLQLVDQKLLMFLQRMPLDTSMLTGNGSLAVVKMFTSDVLGTVVNLKQTLLNVTNSSGIRVMINVADKVKGMYDKAMQFMEENNVLERFFFFADASDTALSCAVELLTMVIGNETAATIDGLVPGADKGKCQETAAIAQQLMASLPPPDAPAGNSTNSTNSTDDDVASTFTNVKNAIVDVMAKVNAAQTGKYAPLFQALGSPPDMRNLPKALAIAVNFTEEWPVEVLQLLIDGDFERASAVVEYQIK